MDTCIDCLLNEHCREVAMPMELVGELMVALSSAAEMPLSYHLREINARHPDIPMGVEELGRVAAHLAPFADVCPLVNGTT